MRRSFKLVSSTGSRDPMPIGPFPRNAGDTATFPPNGGIPWGCDLRNTTIAHAGGSGVLTINESVRFDEDPGEFGSENPETLTVNRLVINGGVSASVTVTMDNAQISVDGQ